MDSSTSTRPTLDSETLAQVRDAAAVLRSGGLVAMPTETVYGLAASAFDPVAVARIFEVKRRPTFDPLIAHIADTAMLDEFAHDIPAAARALMDAFWPGPLTLVLPRRDTLPDIVTSGLPTVACRMPAHPLALELIRAAGVPLAAPSANPFGYISPTTAAHVREQLGEAVDRILDGGECSVGVESTIVGWRDGRATLLRPGGLPVESVESVIGPVARLRRASESDADRPDAPGQLTRHYSPHTPVLLLPRDAGDPAAFAVASLARSDGCAPRLGWLGLRAPARPEAFAQLETLAPDGDLRAAAAALFAAMHRLDAANLDLVVAQPVADEGLGLAINDRLRRAAAKTEWKARADGH